MLRPESDARAIIQPQTPPLRLFLWYLKPFLPPDTFYPLVIHLPAFLPE
jgi:hypothetical protein